MLSKAWPDVAGYTYAETSRGLGAKSRFQGFAFH